ncbi:TetR/AcrR family transcriptional regulator [Nocardioides speluncae]|uniref:TetR/AcrR family transcriptional regulator n=1 Tax=Nocardioides speluncae TaxID=2670337 RepID=UPI000D688135|nr:TetR/AcrR family transcriptional regulator [Nocardioides speluncae]
MASGGPAGARQKMIDSAIVLFRERGVAATSMRDIVDHGGAPRGSIYHHFPGGKQQLALEATEFAGDFIASLLDALAAEAPEAAVDKFVGYWRSALTEKEFQDGCPVASAAVSGTETPEARAAAGRAFGRWEDILARALTERGVPAARAGSLATLVIAAVEGALIMARAQRSDEPLRAVATELRGLL